MTTTDKLIIPLLDRSFTKEDVSLEAGFLGLFENDINRPYLDNHIFLLYDINIDTAIAYNRDKKLSSSESLYAKYVVKIKGFDMTMYVFAITSKMIKNIQRNAFNFTDDEKMRIIAFWNFSDTDINAFMLDPLYTLRIKFVRKTVPEEDYKPLCELSYNKESGALQYRNVPL